MSEHRIINADCLDYFAQTEERWAAIMADPPDGIGLGYNSFQDRIPKREYIGMLEKWLSIFIKKADTVWFSYNSKWTFEVGRIVCGLLDTWGHLDAKHCVQTFTFGQHRHSDLGNNHRPLLRLRWKDAPLYPDQIRVPSWRQLNGDKRADPRGRIPSDVFDFPRVTGNSKQRRSWHPTQLHEGLVERCLLLSTKAGDRVCDPFGGTGTTLRVCKRIDRHCTLVEIDQLYCEKIAKEHEIPRFSWLDA